MRTGKLKGLSNWHLPFSYLSWNVLTLRCDLKSSKGRNNLKLIRGAPCLWHVKQGEPGTIAVETPPCTHRPVLVIRSAALGEPKPAPSKQTSKPSSLLLLRQLRSTGQPSYFHYYPASSETYPPYQLEASCFNPILVVLNFICFYEVLQIIICLSASSFTVWGLYIILLW